MKPLVTVVVCAYNDESTLGTVLEAIVRLKYEPIEVLVINDASSDGTREIIEKFPVLAIHNSSNRGLSYNQNLGLQMAKGQFLVMIQSDCEVLGEDWLDRMMELKDEAAVIVSQRQIADYGSLPAGARLFNAVAPQEIQNTTGAPLELQYCRGKADLYRVSVLRQLGGWNRSFFTAGEDTDLSIRLRQAGFRILLHPSAHARYLFSGRQISVGGAFLKAYLYGKTGFQLYRMHRYDGLQSRTYMVVLMSAVPLAFPHPWNGFAGLALLLFSFTCRIQTSRGFSVRFGVLAVIASALLLWVNFYHRFPAVAFIPSISLLGTGILYTLYLSAKHTAASYRKGESVRQLPGTFVFCFVWRWITGISYFAGACQSLWRKRSIEFSSNPLHSNEK